MPLGTNWSVTINGITKYSTGVNITFTLINGTYNYSVNVPTGYIAENGNGKIYTWNESDIIITVIHTPSTSNSINNNNINIIPVVVAIIIVIIIGVFINEMRKRKKKLYQTNVKTNLKDWGPPVHK